MPVTIVVALVFVAAAALHGYVPGAERAPRAAATQSPWATVVVVALLIMSLAVVAAVALARIFGASPSAPTTTARADWLLGDPGKPSLRTTLIAFGVILGWLLLYVLLSRLGGSDPQTAPPPGADGAPKPAQSAGDAAGAVKDLPVPPDANSPLLGFLQGATVVVLIVLALAVGAIVVAHRQREVAPSVADHYREDPEHGHDAESESLARAAEVALAEVGDHSREPRKAIIACYVAMEGELSLLPESAPRDFDTASEVLARAVEYHSLRLDSAVHLVDLFDEARFSPHVMTEEHRDAAVDTLTRVLGELRSRA